MQNLAVVGFILLHGVVALFPTALINNKLLKGWEQNIAGINSRQFISWFCAWVVGLVAAWQGWGAIDATSNGVLIAESFIGGLVANGLYKVPFVSKVLVFLHLKEA